MDADSVHRRIARIHRVSTDTISRVDTTKGVNYDYQYDTYIPTEVQSSATYDRETNVFSEMRTRLPEIPNNAKSGLEARRIQNALEEHLQDSLLAHGLTSGGGNVFARVEISARSFVMHVEARFVSTEIGFNIMEFLKDSYEQPDVTELVEEC